MNSGSPSNPERQNQSQPVSNAQQSPKLLTQVRNKMRVLHDSIRTESAYVDWIVRFRRVLRIRRCAPLSFSIDRCSNWIRVVWMEYGPGGRSGCPSCCHMRKFEGSLTLVRRAVWCDSSANCFTAPGCDCWKFAGCESKTSTFNADRFSFATARAKKIAWFLSPNDALNRCGSRSRKLERCDRAISPVDMAPYGCLMRLPRSTLLRLGNFCGSSFVPPGESAQILDQERIAGILCTRIPCRNLSALLCCVRKLTRRSVATRFATVSRLICSSPGRISERCRNCWGIRM